jgi:hypothetical protein
MRRIIEWTATIAVLLVAVIILYFAWPYLLPYAVLAIIFQYTYKKSTILALVVGLSSCTGTGLLINHYKPAAYSNPSDVPCAESRRYDC